jgi:hypothetical protein
MTRVINSDTPAKKRNSILKLLVNLVPVMRAEKLDKEARNDIVAFILLSLEKVQKTVEDTIRPWEKRDYWSTSEQFSRQWIWVEKVKESIAKEESQDGWSKWPASLGDLYSHLANVKPTRKKLGEFWKGSYKVYLASKKK